VEHVEVQIQPLKLIVSVCAAFATRIAASLRTCLSSHTYIVYLSTTKMVIGLDD